MSDTFDAYYKWLAIPPEEQPPNHYRLLGVRPFEADADVIANAADQRMSHVRTFQSGKNAAHSQRILNEISAAKLCLLSTPRKAEYDARLRARLAAQAPAAPPAAPGAAGMAAAGMGLPPGQMGYAVAGPGMPMAPAAPLPRQPQALPRQPQPLPQRPAPAPEPGELDDIADSSSRRRSGARGRRNSNSLAGPALLIVFLVAVLAGVAYVVKNYSVNELLSKVDSSLPRQKPKGDRAGEAAAEGHRPGSGRSHDEAEESDSDAADKSAQPSPAGLVKLCKRIATRVAAGQRDVPDYVGGPGGTVFTYPPIPALLVGLEIGLGTPEPPGGQEKTEASEAPSIVSIRGVFLDARPENAAKHAKFRSKVYGAAKASKIVPVNAKPGYAVAALELTPGDQISGLRVVFRAIEESGLSESKSYTENWVGRPTKEPVLLGDGRPVIGIAGKSSTLVNKLGLILEGTGPLPASPAKRDSAEPSDGPAPTTTEPMQRGFVYHPLKSTTGSTPVPTEDELGQARHELRELFRADYAEVGAMSAKAPGAGREKKLALSTRFYDIAEKETDPTKRYALLDEARRLACEAGDPNAVVKALYALVARFQVDDAQLTLDSLTEAGSAPLVPAYRHKLAEMALGFVDLAVKRQRFDVAEKFYDQALKAAKSTHDDFLLQQVKWRHARLADQVKAFDEARPALAKLQEDASDAAANLAAGRYLCFFQEDWDAGRPLLAKGSDADLKRLAERELQPPAEATEQVKLGDAWVAAARDEALAPYYKMRGRQWYTTALVRLGGLSRLDTQEKLVKLLGGHGLNAEYFLGPDFKNSMPHRSVDEQVNFAWASVPADDVPPTPFSVRWTGYLVAPQGGQYVLTVEHNAGARLSIDNKPLIEALAGEGRDESRPFILQANKPRMLKLEYISNGNRQDAKIRLLWRLKDSSTDQPIPPQALFQKATGAEKGFSQLPVPEPSSKLYIATPEAPEVPTPTPVPIQTQ